MMSGGDIAKQLPSEHALFVSGNTDLLPKGLQLRDPFLSLLRKFLIHYIVNVLPHVGYGESLQESYRSQILYRGWFVGGYQPHGRGSVSKRFRSRWLDKYLETNEANGVSSLLLCFGRRLAGDVRSE